MALARSKGVRFGYEQLEKPRVRWKNDARTRSVSRASSPLLSGVYIEKKPRTDVQTDEQTYRQTDGQTESPRRVVRSVESSNDEVYFRKNKTGGGGGERKL